VSKPSSKRTFHQILSDDSSTFEFYATPGDSALSVSVQTTNNTALEVSISQANGVSASVSRNVTTYAFIDIIYNSWLLTLTIFSCRKKHTEQFVFQGLANFADVDIKVRAQFLNQSWSDWVTYGTEIFPGTWITPEVVRQRYSIPTGLGSLHPNNSQSVAEFDHQFYSPSDLDLFSNLMGVPLANVSLVGPNNPKLPGGESTLDIQWITGKTHPISNPL
jgi:hypothetical protein